MNTFIQIGAGAGDLDTRANCRDGFTEHVKGLDPATVGRIILVEPNPINIPLLTQCWKDYPQAEIFNIGICLKSSTNDFITFYYTEEDGPHFQVFSMSKEHVRKHYMHEEIKEKVVKCTTLTKFLADTVGDNDIELLSLDIEGIDAEVILETDWKTLNCSNLSYEWLHLGNNKKIIADTLTAAGYTFSGNGIDYQGYDHLYKKIN